MKQLTNRFVMIVRSTTKSVYHPIREKQSNLIHGSSSQIRYIHAALLVRPKTI
jgi:hypothetical protein